VSEQTHESKASTSEVGMQQSIQHSPSVISHHRRVSSGSCEMPVACVQSGAR